MSEKFTRGDCGHFCEACARRDDKIAVLYEALKDCIEALTHIESMGMRVNPPTLEKAKAALAKAAP